MSARNVVLGNNRFLSLKTREAGGMSEELRQELERIHREKEQLTRWLINLREQSNGNEVRARLVEGRRLCSAAGARGEPFD